MPTPTKLTVRLSAPTVQTLGVHEVTDVAPSLLVLTAAVKLPPKTVLKGMLLMVGVLGVAWPTVKLSELPAAAA